MSNNNFDLFDDDVIKNLEKLKSKYSDYGVNDEGIEAINKNIIRSDPNYNAFEADFASGFSDSAKEPAKPKAEPAAMKPQETVKKEATPARKPTAPRAAAAAGTGAAASAAKKPAAPRTAAPGTAPRRPAGTQRPASQNPAAAPQRAAGSQKPAAAQRPVSQNPAEPQRPSAPQRPVSQQRPAAPQRPVAPQRPAADIKKPVSSDATAAPEIKKPVTPAYEDIDSDFVEFKTDEPTRKLDGINDYHDFDGNNKYETEVKTPDKKKDKKKSGKKKKKTHKLRNTLLIVFILAVIWGTFFGVDYVLISNWKEPVFCIKTDEFKNGSVSYMGLFYKFQYHNDDNGDKESLCMPWFKAGPNDTLERKSEKNKSVKADANISGSIAAADNSIEVYVTIPEDYLGFLGEEFDKDAPELTPEQKQQGYKAVMTNKNDKTITFTLGKADHLMAIETIKTAVIENLENLATSADFPSIKKEEHNADNFSSVILYVDQKEYKSNFDYFVEQYVFENIGYYQSFAQQELKCKLTIKDVTTNEEIQSFNITDKK